MSRHTHALARATTHYRGMQNFGLAHCRLVRSVRVLALVLMVGGCVALVRANDAEASAIFRAGGDAGMWGVGLMFALMLLIPGAVLSLFSLVMSPRSAASANVAGAAGVAVLGPTAWLAVNLYPPDKETGEGRPLKPALWDHVADVYLFAFVLLGAAGALLLLSAFVRPDWAGGQARQRQPQQPAP